MTVSVSIGITTTYAQPGALSMYQLIVSNEHAQEQNKRKEVKRFCCIVTASCSAALLVPGESSYVNARIDYAGVVEPGDAESEALRQCCFDELRKSWRECDVVVVAG